MNALAVFLLSTTVVLAENTPLFQEYPAEKSGVKFHNTFDVDHKRSYLYHSGFAVGGIALGDVNGDGLLDIYLVDGPKENALFLREKSGSYRKASVSNPDDKSERWGTGASLVDIDNDGDLDLYQCNYDSPNQLFLNDGKGSFTELKGAGGLAVQDASMMANFADVDNDGDLDMYLLCNRMYDPKGRPEKPPFEDRKGGPVIKEEFKKYYELKPRPEGGYKVDSYGRADYLFINEGNDKEGNPKFKDVSKESGMQRTGYGLSCVWWDYDGDGDQDLYVANDFVDEDRLMRNDGLNENGVVTFTDVAGEKFPATTWSSMGSDVADVNRDGLPDLMSLDMSATTHFKAKSNMGTLSDEHRRLLTVGYPRQAMRNHLFLNNGSHMFIEAANATGLSSSDWSWTVKFGDLDNDGFQDVFISNGMSRNFTDADRNNVIGPRTKAMIGRTSWDLFKKDKAMKEENVVFKNLDGKKFKMRKDWGLGLTGMSYSAAMGDLDNDGDLDIVVSDLGADVRIYENQSQSGNGLRVKLQGVVSNRMAIGAKVIVEDSAGVKHTRWQNVWSGFQSQNDSVIHVGMGTANAKKITVEWPSGVVQEVSVKPSDKEVMVIEKGERRERVKRGNMGRFAAVDAPKYLHKENVFDDFKRQPLLPSKLSQLGPCLAKGDVDGDGDEDFYVGGGATKPGVLFLNSEGGFKESKQKAFSAMAPLYGEDTAAVWFDADGDGDLDLYVVTGSTEYVEGGSFYADHLYLNETKDGKVVMKRAKKGEIPKLLDSGSCVCAADYDGDGDMDLFVGSRSVVGKYPSKPENRLLRNDTADGKVKFTEVTPEEIKTFGMVTSAQWADMDKDGDPELVLCADWGTVGVFQNDGGELKLIDSPEMSQLKGWWGALQLVDVDKDGDLDIVMGNTGINTKYKKPSNKKPALIYYGDLDGSGVARIVEAKYSKTKGRPLPVRGRS